MAFSVPTLADVSRTIENGFSAAFYGKSGSLRVGVLKVISRVVAGGCYLPILFCQYIFRNSFIDTCDVENLIRFGGWYNLPHKVASNASGQVIIVSAQTVTIQKGAIIVDPDTNDEFELQEPVSCTPNAIKYGNVVSVGVGQKFNRANNYVLKFRDIDNDGIFVKSFLISGGALFEVSVNGLVEEWGEDVESYRKRLKYRRQHHPMGGSVSDYKQWAERFSQVTDAFVFGNFPLTNAVTVFCADFNSDGIVLNSSELEDVKKYILSDARKPATADVRIKSVSAVEMSLTVGLSSVGGNVKQRIVDVLKTNLKGYGFGEKITTDLIKRIIVENGVVSSCSVTQLYVKGYNVTDNGYTTAKTADNGEIVDINKIEKNLSLVVV